MAQYRQSGVDRFANGVSGAGGFSDQISSHLPYKQGRFRRPNRFDRHRKVPLGTVFLIISVVFVLTFLIFGFLTRDKDDKKFNDDQDDNEKNEADVTSKVSQRKAYKVHFGHGSVMVGRDSRYWDKDDRRRDDEYDGEDMDLTSADDVNHSAKKDRSFDKRTNENKPFSEAHAQRKSKSLQGEAQKVVGLYNEAGRDELKHYEAEYEASLKSTELSNGKNKEKYGLSEHRSSLVQYEDADSKVDYDDGIDFDDSPLEEYGETLPNDVKKEDQDEIDNGGKSLDNPNGSIRNPHSVKEAEVTDGITEKIERHSSLSPHSSPNVHRKLKRGNVDGETMKSSTSAKRTDSKRGKHHKFSGSSCEMKFLNSTAQLMEPLESKKFSRFSLQYTEVEDKPSGSEDWEPRFAGHQTLQEREQSFYAQDLKINCGFVKGPPGYQSTGFDLSEDDRRYMSSCHIAVSSCIFGNSDRLRTPSNKVVTRFSRKNVCFVMFIDENTLQLLSSEGQSPDSTGFIGLWKIVVVKNLPSSDMRRVGKIPKFLTHRLFPSARYSIWLDSKLRLQSDPYLILEYFLWRHNYEYAISNHYARHCVWEEVAQNKKLNKFNHTIIDQQFEFYQKDGLQRFNASDPNKLLPSYVPEGSFIVRAHTPMSNLFSCLWFNEVDRFTPRDQLSFAYTFLKLTRMNPGKPFRLNMFKDCERRSIAKLFHHRAEEKRNVHAQAVE